MCSRAESKLTRENTALGEARSAGRKAEHLLQMKIACYRALASTEYLDASKLDVARYEFWVWLCETSSGWSGVSRDLKVDVPGLEGEALGFSGGVCVVVIAHVKDPSCKTKWHVSQGSKADE